MLREHVEDGHNFSPVQVLGDKRVQGVNRMADMKVHQLNKIKK
jgi:hypothetical protein